MSLCDHDVLVIINENHDHCHHHLVLYLSCLDNASDIFYDVDVGGLRNKAFSGISLGGGSGEFL